MHIKVNNVDEAEKLLKKLKIQDYKISPNGDVNIYDNVKIKDMVSAFTDASIDILGINSSDESVEEYYLNLIKEKEAN